MNISALLTSAGINIGVCVLLLSLYSILRKQPSNKGVYFGRRLAQVRTKRQHNFCFDRFVPSPSWVVKAWTTSEEEMLAIAGLDAVVFIRILVFSIRIFSIAAVICFVSVLPLNYYGQEMDHKEIPSESLEVFTIGNIKEGSKSLWVHCLALYLISCSTSILLYFEYKSITKMRLSHITGSPPNPSHFAVLVRSIPWSSHETYSDSVRKFFTNYHAGGYLSHQMVYHNGTVKKIMNGAENMYNFIKTNTIDKPSLTCGFCGTTNSFKILSSEESVNDKTYSEELHLNASTKECAATAFVLFRTRYAAIVASHVLQSSNPMLWVTELAPEPHDVYWPNLCIPYKQLWIRRLAVLLSAFAFMFVFLIPVTFVQGLTQLDQLKEKFPSLKEVLKKRFLIQLATGYLPSVILILSLYIVPPVMMLFSAVQGHICRSDRKKSAACKVLYFLIWNVFFVNVLSGSVISQLDAISSPKDIPTLLARAVPRQATFFITYVLTSGWASLSSEIIQLFALVCNMFSKFILRNKDDPSNGTLSFPYHTEVPKVLLFGLLGFTCSILAPLILPFLLVYFLLAYLVYRNQFLNVYISKYESGGQFWPVVHNITIFSLVLTQIIALGMFGLKRSSIASGFTIPLVIFTLLFHEYCRLRFLPIFNNHAAELLIEMDREDERSGRMEDIHRQVHSAYCQITSTSHKMCNDSHPENHDNAETDSDLENIKPGNEPIQVNTPLKARCDMEASSKISGTSLMPFLGPWADISAFYKYFHKRQDNVIY